MQRVNKSWLGIFCTLIGIALHAAHAGEWERVVVPQGSYTVPYNGGTRTVQPSCIGENGVPSNYEFSFKPGKSDKLLVFFNGGGACWNFATTVLGARANPPICIARADIPFNDPKNWGGLFDAANTNNPYRDWSALFVSYCSGDVHLGGKQQTYTGFVPTPSGPVQITTAVQHRGSDNFLYALNWLRQRLGTAGVAAVDKLLVSGSSAGAYGAAFNYGHLRQMFPSAKGHLLADAGNGVVEESFLASALRMGSSWQIGANLPGFMSGVENQPADSFIVSAYALLTTQYPRDRFAQFTNNWDVVQTSFLNIMQNPDNPLAWQDPAQLFARLIPWQTKMRTFASLQSGASNYRYFIAPGCDHTNLRSNRFYSDSAAGVSFLSWAQALTGSQRAVNETWRNLSCDPATDCPLPATEISACLQRAFAQ